MSDVLALLALMNQGGGSGITEEQVKELIEQDSKMVLIDYNSPDYWTIRSMVENNEKIPYFWYNSYPNSYLFIYQAISQETGHIAFRCVSGNLTVRSQYLHEEGYWTEQVYKGATEDELKFVALNDTNVIDYNYVLSLVQQGKYPIYYREYEGANHLFIFQGYNTSTGTIVLKSLGGGLKTLYMYIRLDGITYGSDEAQPKLTAGEGITIEGSTISASGGGSSYTFTDGLTETDGTVKWDLNDSIKKGTGTNAVRIGEASTYNTTASSISATGEASMAVGFAQGYKSGSASIRAGADGSLAGGHARTTGSSQFSAGASIQTSGNSGGKGELAFGCADSIENSGAGLYAQGAGAIALGYSHSNTSSSDNFGKLEAVGNGAIAIGTSVKAMSNYQVALGKCNIADSQNKYVLIVGNGEYETARSNALTVDWAGNIVCNNIPACPTDDGNYVLKCSIVGGVPTYSWVSE